MNTSLNLPLVPGRRRSAASRLINLLFALAVWPGTAMAQSANPVLLTTFTNPAPTVGYGFGFSPATVGNDRVLIGDLTGNLAYLFDTSGTLLVTFTYPNPERLGAFGYPVAAMGSDRVLIGAPGNDTVAASAGAVYLFSTNGTLLNTFTNPIPSSYDGFGASVAAVGSDRVLIGAIDFAVTFSGTAYLFSTNGVLLTTFTNPAPAAADQYGASVAAFGNDRVFVGKLADNGNSGTAYLFRTNGTLLTAFHNPTPEAYDRFGLSVTGVGNDRVLIGAGGQNTGAPGSGAAYLFSTNGALVTTFTNPSPSAYDSFGFKLAAVGSSRVIIGGDSIEANGTGAAYLFSTNGTLLTTITNPAAMSGNFGFPVAAVGNDRVLIGAYGNSSGGVAGGGAAYLFALPYPPLSISQNAGTVSVSWVTAETGLILRQTDSLGAATLWSDTTNAVSVNGPTNLVQQTIPNGSSSRFYHLHRP